MKRISRFDWTTHWILGSIKRVDLVNYTRFSQINHMRLCQINNYCVILRINVTAGKLLALILEKPLDNFIASFEFEIIKRSHWQMFFKIGVLKDFANFTEKHLCWSLFLIKKAWKPAPLLKKESRLFFANIAKFFKSIFDQF